MIQRLRPLMGLVATTAIIFGACSTPAATTAPSAAPTAAPSAAPATAAPTAAPATAAPTAAPATAAPATAAPSSAAPSTAAPTVAATSAAPSAAAGGGTLTAQLYQDFTSFDPWSKDGTGGDTIMMSFQWDALAVYNDDASIQYRLATEITGSADAKTYTAKLRDGVTWSDGTPFTAADVLFSWKQNANPNQSANFGLWSNVVGDKEWIAGKDFSKDIAGITAPDDHTVVWKLVNPDGAFIATLLNFRNYILPRHVLTDKAVIGKDIFTLNQKDVWALPFWQAPTVAIGPFKWSKTETGQFFEFEANPTYWQGKPPFDKVILKPISDFAVSAAQLQSGDLDFAQVTLNDLSGLESAGFTSGVGVAPFPIQTDYNTSEASVMHDVRVRQAMMYGCDRQGFVDSFLQGKGKKVDSYFFPAWVPKDGIKEYNFDPAKAKELLDAAKADGKFDYAKPIRWLSWNKDARDRQSFIEDCQSKMAEIGVKIEITNGLEVTGKLGNEGNWDMQLYGGYPVQDPNALKVPLSCGNIGKEPATDAKNAKLYFWGGSNAVNWCNKDFDAAMDAGSATADQAVRAEAYKKAQDIYLEEVPIQISYINANAFAWSTKVTGVVVHGDPSQWGWDIMKWSKSA